jgi:hypothetical protein
MADTATKEKRERQRQRDASGSSRSDYADLKRQAKMNDKAQGDAIKAQMRSEGKNPATGQPYKSGPNASAAPSTPAPANYRPSYVPKVVHNFVGSSTGGSIAGAMLGALAFFTGRAYIQGGFPAVKAFYAAKFLNRTTSQPNPVPASAASSTTATAGAAVTPAGAATNTNTQVPGFPGDSIGVRTPGSRVKAAIQ